MKQVFAIALLLIFTAGCATVAPQKNQLPTTSYVKIENMFMGVSLVSQGSGVVYDTQPEGSYVLTAAHVCLNSSPAIQPFVRVTGGKRYLSQVMRVDVSQDVCVLFVENWIGESVAIAKSGPEKGDEVFAISSPFGFEDLTIGLVPIIRGTYFGGAVFKSGKTVDMYSLRIAPGSSGGMIVNLDGELIGMTHSLFVLGGRGPIGYTDISMGPDYSSLMSFLFPDKPQ